MLCAPYINYIHIFFVRTIFEEPVSIAANVLDERVMGISRMLMWVIGNFQEEEQGIEGGGDTWKVESEIVAIVS